MSTSFNEAVRQYAAYDIDVESAFARLERTPISLHCWQGDDLGGFEKGGTLSGSGLAATGNYPGKARTPEELKADLDKALSLIPGKHRVNLHAFYPDPMSAGRERDSYTIDQFQGWVDWAAERKLGLDFNPTCFAHPKAGDGFTLSHTDREIRKFWIDHCKASRKIGEAIGRQLGSPCVTNVWIPDGFKDLPADRLSPRRRLADALDEIFEEPLNPDCVLDAVESKLFGIGSESYVVGSHEFYLGYAVSRQKVLCLDTGHFHPTEGVADKISSVLLYVPQILLHVSRGVRWDSDHVVLFDDPTRAIMEELVRGNFLSRTHIGLDFFDASINRIAAWVIGTRNTQKALLTALLEPTHALRELEGNGDFTGRLALLEELKSLPFGPVWDEFCKRQNVPVGMAWLDEVRTYEAEVFSQRK